jgi:hypothetical protein
MKNIIQVIRITGLFYTIAFVITSLIFIFFDVQLLQIFNSISQSILLALPLAHEQSNFFKVLAISMMFGITLCSYLIFKDVEKYMIMALPLAAMKFASSICSVLFFVWGFLFANGYNTLATIAIFFTDFPLGLWILYLYTKYQQLKQ